MGIKRFNLRNLLLIHVENFLNLVALMCRFYFHFQINLLYIFFSKQFFRTIQDFLLYLSIVRISLALSF